MARVRGSAGTTRGFLSSIAKWEQGTKEAARDVFRNGALDFYDALAAATPVDTGNLRNSLVAHANGTYISTVTGPGESSSDSTYRSGAIQSIATIMSLELGDKVTFVYHASYARRLNYGFTGYDSLGRFYNQPGRFWIERVGSRYKAIMRSAASRFGFKLK